ncbi:MAG: endonuclease/exonuclease/phosphatase family protein [Pseudomonadota bacterium]
MGALARGLFGALALAAFAGLALGVLGPLAPFFDSFAHFRAHGAVALAFAGAVLIALGWRWRGGLTVAVAAAAFATVVTTFAPVPAQEGETRLLQMNLLLYADIGPALDAIAQEAPDLVVLQEVAPHHRPALAGLAAYPHQALCLIPAGFDGVALLSKHPFVGDGGCLPRDQLLWRRVALPGGAVTVASFHAKLPWPFSQTAQFARIRPALEALPAPRVIAGDLNAVPWSASVERFERAAGVAVARGVGGTWPAVYGHAAARWLGLSIDHVLVSDGVRVVAARTLPATASDHLPVSVTFSGGAR